MGVAEPEAVVPLTEVDRTGSYQRFRHDTDGMCCHDPPRDDFRIRVAGALQLEVDNRTLVQLVRQPELEPEEPGGYEDRKLQRWVFHPRIFRGIRSPR